MQSKAEIQSNTDEKYLGYISRLYTYYAADPYFDKLVVKKDNVVQTQLCLWIIFCCFNVLVPILCITRGKKISEKLYKHSPTSRVLRAVIITTFLFNAVYFSAAVLLHSIGYPTVLDCYFSTANYPCRIPRSASFYDNVLGVLITKAVILPVALIVELAAAVGITKGLSTTKTKPALFMHVIVVWQLFVFLHITVGLVSIPIVILTLISPASSLMMAGIGLLTFTILICFLAIVPCPSMKASVGGCLKSTMTAIEVLLIAITVFAIYYSYSIIVKEGINMSGVKGYAISLFPSLPITTIIWVVIKRYRKNRALESKRGEENLRPLLAQRHESVSTQEEVINFSEDSM